MSKDSDSQRHCVEAMRKLDELESAAFLRLALGSPRRPIDDLLDRLDLPSGRIWLEAVLEKGPTSLHGPAQGALVEGKASLAELVDIKESSKGLVKRIKPEDAQLAGMVGYFLSVAAALVHHQRLICGRSHEELVPLLLDFAAVLPDPWSNLVSRACEKAAGAPDVPE